MAGIDSDGRWRAYGGLAGVFVFCSIAITGALWTGRRSPVIRGEDAAEVAAAAYERRWALWRSRDPGSLPPRFAPRLSTNEVPVRRAALNVSGFPTWGGRSLAWEGDPASWQPAAITFAIVETATNRWHEMLWTLGSETLPGRWLRVGRASSNDYPHALSDTGGVFEAHGFAASPPCMEGCVNRYALGAPRFAVSFRPDPSFPWPVVGTNRAECLVTNTPGFDEALWPHMAGGFIRRAALSLRDSFGSLRPAWLYGGADADASPVSGGLDAFGQPALTSRWPCASCPFPAAGSEPPGGWWRALTLSTNESTYSDQLGFGGRWDPLPRTNLLWECLRAATNMTRAFQWASYAQTNLTTVFKYWTNGVLSECYTNDAHDFHGTFSSAASPDGTYVGEEAAAAELVRYSLYPSGRDWPCASACASGLVARIRVCLFPEASAGVPAPVPCGRYVERCEPDGMWLRYEPLSRPPLLAAEFTPAEWASGTNLYVTLRTGLTPEALRDAARSAAVMLAPDYTPYETWLGHASFDPGGLLIVADFDFRHLAPERETK